MSERERRVLNLRYGLEDGISRTLGETAKFFGITRERVRQIEVAALRKLRALLATEKDGSFDQPIGAPSDGSKGAGTARQQTGKATRTQGATTRRGSARAPRATKRSPGRRRAPSRRRRA